MDAHGTRSIAMPRDTELEGLKRASAHRSHDNALAETVIGLFKTKVIHRRGPWRSLEGVEYATLEWVDWYNARRLLEPIGSIPPAEAEARYYNLTGASRPGGMTQAKVASGETGAVQRSAAR